MWETDCKSVKDVTLIWRIERNLPTGFLQLAVKLQLGRQEKCMTDIKRATWTLFILDLGYLGTLWLNLCNFSKVRF